MISFQVNPYQVCFFSCCTLAVSDLRFSLTWSLVLSWMSFKHEPTLLTSSLLLCSPLRRLSLYLFPVLLFLLSFLTCYELTEKLKVFIQCSIKVSPNHRCCSRVHVSATLWTSFINFWRRMCCGVSALGHPGLTRLLHCSLHFLANNVSNCPSWIMQVATISSMGAWITVMWNEHSLSTDFLARHIFFP